MEALGRALARIVNLGFALFLTWLVVVVVGVLIGAGL